MAILGLYLHGQVMIIVMETSFSNENKSSNERKIGRLCPHFFVLHTENLKHYVGGELDAVPV
jgi:hypothetical protein